MYLTYFEFSLVSCFMFRSLSIFCVYIVFVALKPVSLLNKKSAKTLLFDFMNKFSHTFNSCVVIVL